MNYKRAIQALQFLGLVIGAISALAVHALSLTPKEITLKIGEKALFTANDAVGKVNWWVVKGDLSKTTRADAALVLSGVPMGENLITLADATKAQYTAPTIIGRYSLAATDGQSLAVAAITVLPASGETVVQPTWLEILGGDRNLTEGQSLILSLQGETLTKELKNYNREATWASSDDSIVSVDQGKITALKTGAAEISATVVTLTAKIKVTVVAESAVGLAITPSPLYTTVGQTSAIGIAKMLKQGGKTAASDCTLTADASGVVSVAAQNVTAIKSGYAKVNVVCGSLTGQLPVFVSADLPLSAHPATLSAIVGDKATLTVSGGIAPYTVTATTGQISGQSDSWIYQAPRIEGEDKIIITSSDGHEISVPVAITGGLTLSPMIDSVLDGSSKLTATGGKPPYDWTVTAGSFADSGKGATTSDAGQTVVYLPPKTKGVYQVNVRDQGGQIRTATINVDAGLIATPAAFLLSPKKEARFQISGGKPPYVVSVEYGSYVEEADGYYYTAPELAGDYQIHINDSEGHNTVIDAAVQVPLNVTPTSLFLLHQEEAELTVNGGAGGYKFFTKTGDVGQIEQTAEKTLYKAAKLTGEDVISIRDKTGTQVQVNVSVSSTGFFSTPAVGYVLPAEGIQFRALGGTAPYTWAVKGEGTLSANEGAQVTFTAPTMTGEYQVTAVDNTGQTAASTVYVYHGQLQITPTTLTIERGAQAALKAILGVPGEEGKGYLWSVERGKLSSLAGATVTYTAPFNGLNDVVTVEDATGLVQVLKINLDAFNIKASDTYAGKDGTLDNEEANKALADFFSTVNTEKPIMTKQNLFEIAERLLSP